MKEATFEIYKWTGVSWNLSWTSVPSARLVCVGDTIVYWWRYWTAILLNCRYEVRWPDSQSNPRALDLQPAMVAASAVHTECAHRWNGVTPLYRAITLFFYNFFQFPPIFKFWVTQSLTYTKGDAMMLYSHNAHQNTSPKSVILKYCIHFFFSSVSE